MIRRHWTLLASILPLLGWWTYGLFDLDEGFYAAIAQEMNRRGEWITPFYNGKPWFEKPILVYWLLKPSLALFGDTFGPRLPSVLTTIALYVLCAWFAKRRLSEGAARWVPVVLGSSLLVIGTGRMVLTDPPFDLALAAAFLLFWESLVGDRRWRVASAACLGLAVLAKGPVAGALFLPVAAWVALRQPDLRPAYRGGWPIGSVVFALVVAAWYLPCYLQNGQVFVHDFLYEQNVQRFRGGDEAHRVPFLPFGWAFYPLLIAVGFAPWWWWLRRAWAQTTPVEGFLKAWAVTVFAFFTISGAKLPHYILPALPPLALLVAARLSTVELRPRRIVPGLVAAAVVANAAFLGYYYGVAPLGLAGFHDEVQRLARYVRDHQTPGDDVALFSLPRVDGLPGKPGIRVAETGHPSLLLYLDRNATTTDQGGWRRLLATAKPLWIITRWNRVTPEMSAEAGGRLHPVDPFPPNLYRLYRLDPAR